ncbi:MAG: hypothetical protein Q4D98_10485 [Planctomycetia bacterium]|nr:hypothetical protein [Planctomycetia bacterium]
MPDFTPYQQRVIRNYYNNLSDSSAQKLAELATDLYLAEGKKRAACWKRAVAAMEHLKVPKDRIQKIVDSDDPVLLANLVKEFH